MKVSIIGCGTMGCGIAQVISQKGHKVIFLSHSEDSIKKGLEKLKENLIKAVEKGKLTQLEGQSILGNIKISWNYNDTKNSDLVIEAVSEDVNLKKQVFREIDKINKNAILASNTSSISISEIASATSKPEKVIGMHFFNPVPVMKLVELVRGKKTSQQTLDAVKKFVEELGKTPVEVKDSPGFVSNRILMLFINESINLLKEGVATKEGIDTIAKLGFNHPMGPIELADYIGLDVCLDILNSIYTATKDPKFRPSSLLEEKVKKGELGRKGGKGFYLY